MNIPSKIIYSSSKISIFLLKWTNYVCYKLCLRTYYRELVFHIWWNFQQLKLLLVQKWLISLLVQHLWLLCKTLALDTNTLHFVIWDFTFLSYSILPILLSIQMDIPAKLSQSNQLRCKNIIQNCGARSSIDQVIFCHLTVIPCPKFHDAL